jgi:hypothetical protein
MGSRGEARARKIPMTQIIGLYRERSRHAIGTRLDDGPGSIY